MTHYVLNSLLNTYFNEFITEVEDDKDYIDWQVLAKEDLEAEGFTSDEINSLLDKTNISNELAYHISAYILSGYNYGQKVKTIEDLKQAIENLDLSMEDFTEEDITILLNWMPKLTSTTNK